MNEPHSKSAWLYRQIRRELRSGRFPPGRRIEPRMLAAEFKTSPTPVRLALSRLVGEGLLVDNEREGLHVPPASEVELRDLYEWMEKLLLMACDRGIARTKEPRHFDLARPDADIVKLTWKLFDAIAFATADLELYEAIRRANDRLAPVRRAAHTLISDATIELEQLQQLWKLRDLEGLRQAVVTYHERRKRLVPQIVALLNASVHPRH